MKMAAFLDWRSYKARCGRRPEPLHRARCSESSASLAAELRAGLEDDACISARNPAEVEDNR